MTETAAAERDRPATAGDGDRPSVGIVGAGRAGTVLAMAFDRAGIEVAAVASRRPDEAARLAGRLGRPAEVVARAEDVLDRAEVVWLTVPDDQLAPLASGLAAERGRWPGRVAVHCAGRFDRSVLAPLRATGADLAACHPLAALARPAPDPLRGAAAAVDADPGARRRVRALALRIGLRPVTLAPDRRVVYHATCVLAGNLPLLLLAAAERIGGDAGLPAALVAGLRPLLEGALANATALGTAAALTGPAVRRDRGALAAHAAALQRIDPAVARAYRAVSALAGSARSAGAASA